MKSMIGAKASVLLASVVYAPVVAQPIVQPAVATASQKLGSAERQSIIENMATAYQARYTLAEAGARIAARLRQQLAAGAYDAFTNPSDFAAAITADLRTAVQDDHLRAAYEPNRGPAAGGMQMVRAPGRSGPASLPTVDPRSTAQIARANYGFDRVERLRGNVGYLKLSQFVPLAISADTATAAMNFLSNADAMIVDLRGLPGGSPDLVARLISYFTGEQPVRLLTSYHRASDTTVELSTEAKLPGRRMTGKPLYVLIDGSTASAGEMFSYIAQRQKLGTLVGVKTSGLGNGGNMVPAGSGITFFLPERRVTDGPGWERIGVSPDVKTTSEQALPVAHAAAIQRLVQEASDPALKREREWALELVTASAKAGAPMTPSTSAYAGLFGTRTFSVEGEQLVVAPQNGRRETLTRVSPDLFRSERARYAFERDSSGRVRSVSIETIDGARSRADRTA